MSNARKLGNMTTHGLDGDFNVDPTDNTLVVNSTNNRVGIGSATPTTTLDITGTATATAFSGPLTGNVTGTTSSISNHDTDALSEGSTNLYYTNARADARAQLKIDALVDSAPNTLDTLNELAAALGDDANFSTTITNSIATKLPLAGGTVTGELNVDAQLKANQLRLSKNGDSTSIGATIGLSNAGGDTNSNDITITAANSTNSIVLRSAINIDTQTYQSGSWNSRLKILQNGNVGIGTSSPSTNLQVDGDWASDYGTMSISGPQNALTGIGLRANNTYVGSIIWRDGSTGTGGSSHLEINSYLSNPIELRTNNIARVTIDGSSGNVGIGTTSPSADLHISSTVQPTIRVTDSDNNNTAFMQADGVNGAYFGTLTNHPVRLAPNNSTKMIVTTDGNVGICTSSPSSFYSLADNLVVGTGTGGNGMTIYSGSADSGYIGFNDTVSASMQGFIQYNHSGDYMAFAPNGAEKMRIDSSGSLMVGKTSLGVANLGFAARYFGSGADGGTTIEVAKDNATVMYMNRTSSEGTIIDFRKDNTPVGSIGIEGGDVTIGKAASGLQFRAIDPCIRPHNMSTNSPSDNAVDLGRHNSRFKDLYLSGGVYLGGTGSANKLDDYEEGTFNFTMGGYYGNPTTTQLIPANYVKIGNTVNFIAYKTGVNNTGAAGNMWFTGLPFATIGRYPVGGIQLVNIGTYPSNTAPFTHISGTIVYAMRHISNGSPEAIFHNTSTNGKVYLSGTYQTNA